MERENPESLLKPDEPKKKNPFKAPRKSDLEAIKASCISEIDH